MINCYRNLDDLSQSPFINKCCELKLDVQIHPINNKEYGVNFNNKPDMISPHIYETHCESSLHVYNKEYNLNKIITIPTLSEVLECKSEYQNEIIGLHIKVNPTLILNNKESLKIIKNEIEKSYHITFDNESYCIYNRNSSDITIDSFYNDKVITKKEIEYQINNAELVNKKDINNDIINNNNDNNVKVLLIDILGEENQMSNWAYLTIDATKYIIDLNYNIIIINTPSIDRENDGGYVPNHKIIFNNKYNLIIELAKLSHIPSIGYGNVLLDIIPHNIYKDCGACHLKYELIKYID